MQISHSQPGRLAASNGVGKIRGTAGQSGQQQCAPRVAHHLLSKKIILALSVCLCASDRHGAIRRPSQGFPLFFLIFILQNGRQTCRFGLHFFAPPGLVVCVLSSFCSYGAHPIKQLWKWSKKWVLVAGAGRNDGCEIVDFKGISGNWN